MAANTDLFKKGARKWVGQIGAAGVSDASVTTIPLASATSLPTDTAVVAVIDRVDSTGTKTASLEESVIGVVSGSNLVTCTRGVEGTAQAHLAGAVVEILITNKGWNDLIDGILQDHTQLGYHETLTDANGNEWIKQTATASAVNEFTVANAVTGSGPSIVSTGGDTNIDATISGKGTGKVKIGQATSDGVVLVASQPLMDANSNELLKFTATASAVNEPTLANAATGTNPVLSMTGGDTDVGFDIKMKAAGRFRKPTIVGIQVVDSATATATGDGKAFFRIPAELNGMNLTGVSASVYTAGTTNTTDIQIRNKTQTADMLTTKITIDSGETDTSTAAAAAVIDTGNDDVATGDIIAIDVDAVSTTPAQGLFVELRFELP